MKLIRAEQQLDRAYLVFYFTADGRIDFRELVRDLATEFHCRIEMRQIGARDEAKAAGRVRVLRAPALLHDVAAGLRADLHQDGQAPAPQP